MERNKSLYKSMREEIGRCELCGSKRDLEMHHIIPLSLIADNPYADTQDNLLCVCSKCHALLTPRKILTSIGVRKAINRQNDKVKQFYTELNEMAEDGERLDVETVLDVFDKIFIAEMENENADRSD